MQAGDLADGPLADVLRSLAAAHATGGVHVRRREEAATEADPERSGDAVLFLRDGRLYAATAPGPRPLLGVRLVAAGAVTREALEEALESQAGDLAGWRLGELLVHLGYVDADIVAEFVVEQIIDTVAEVSAWPAGGWRFRRGEKTRDADGLALDVDDVLEQAADRRLSWRNLAESSVDAGVVPVRTSFDEALEAAQIPLARTLLSEIDGRRTLAQLATRCGLTTFEAGYVLAQLVASGAVARPGEISAPEADSVLTQAPDIAAQPDVLAVLDLPATPAVPAAAPDAPDLPPDLTGDLIQDTGIQDPGIQHPGIHGPGPDSGPDSGPAAEPDPTPDLAPAPPADGDPAPPAAPLPVAASADDDLAALFGGDDEVDLATQLAVLARQAEEARWAAEARQHQEIAARRQAAADALARVHAIDLTPHDRAVVDATDTALVAGLHIEPNAGAPEAEPDTDDASAQVDVEAEPAAPPAPIGLAPLYTAYDEQGRPIESSRAAFDPLLDAFGSGPEIAAPLEVIDIAPLVSWSIPPAATEDTVEGMPGDATGDATNDTASDTASDATSDTVQDGDEAVLFGDNAAVAWQVRTDADGAPASAAPAVASWAETGAAIPAAVAETFEVLADPLEADVEPAPAAPDAVDWAAAYAEPLAPVELPVAPDAVDWAAAYAEPLAPEPLAAQAAPSMPPSAPPRPNGLPEHRTPATSIGDPAEFVPTIPPADDRAAIHAALAEVAAAGFGDLLGSDDEPAPRTAVPTTPAEEQPAAWHVEPPPSTDYTPDLGETTPMADTAALLRELSFLGLEDAPPATPAPSRPPAPRPAPSSAGTTKVKRKSIFGR